MERLLITGAGGLLAEYFREFYSDKYEMRFLTTYPTEEGEYYWDPMEDELDPYALEGVDHILHLVGSMLMPSNRNVRDRDILQTYRVNSIALIGRMLMARRQKVKSIITASSCYYYGVDYSPYIYTEHHKAGSDYYARIDQAAEEESYILEVEKLAERSVCPRFGHILCRLGGLLPHIAVGSHLGISISHGLGRQIIPWVHIIDACRVLDFIIEHEEMAGAYNCVAPEWISYREMAENCTSVRSGKVLPIHLPRQILKYKYGRFANHFLRSSRVSMTRLMNSGFEFEYPDFISAMMNIYGE